MRTIVRELAEQVGLQQACEVLAYPRSRYYGQLGTTAPHTEKRQPAVSHRALPASERETVREILNSERFVDSSPRQIYGTLLDEEQYFCSISTLYRILRENDEVATQQGAD